MVYPQAEKLKEANYYTTVVSGLAALEKAGV